MTQERPVALVTGSSRGIGKAIAVHLATAGYQVAAVARSIPVDGPKEGDILPLRLDVTDAGGVEAAVAEVEARLGPVDLLVNNAGVAGPAGLVTWEHAPADWWRVFEVNMLGAFLCCRAVMPSMVARHAGRIVNVASNAAFLPIVGPRLPTTSEYLASKAALVRFGEALAAEAAPYGVGVFTVAPGMVKTAMTAEAFAAEWDDDPAIWSPPELVAELVEFIASGALDALSGRYIQAARDDWRTMGERARELVEQDQYAVRLRHPGVQASAYQPLTGDHRPYRDPTLEDEA